MKNSPLVLRPTGQVPSVGSREVALREAA